MKRKLHFARQRLQARKARRKERNRFDAWVRWRDAEAARPRPPWSNYRPMFLTEPELADKVQRMLKTTYWPPPVFKDVQLADNWPREDLPRTPPAN